MKTPGGGGYGSANELASCSDNGINAANTARTFFERGTVFEYRQAQESA